MHFHAHTGALHTILEYAIVMENQSLIELVQKAYEYGKRKGNVLLGYFPEFVGSERLEHSELCEVADMIALGVKLTETGCFDYSKEIS